jgi:hypothetical protein
MEDLVKSPGIIIAKAGGTTGRTTRTGPAESAQVLTIADTTPSQRFQGGLLPRQESRSGFPSRRAWKVGLDSPTDVRIFFARVICPGGGARRDHPRADRGRGLGRRARRAGLPAALLRLRHGAGRPSGPAGRGGRGPGTGRRSLSRNEDAGRAGWRRSLPGGRPCPDQGLSGRAGADHRRADPIANG